MCAIVSTDAAISTPIREARGFDKGSRCGRGAYLQFPSKGECPLARFRSLGERTFSGGKRYILFICTGNTCRSPIAYGVMRKLLGDAGITDLEIRTAGVMTVPGLMPTQECRQLLLKDGIDISNHRSCQLTADLIKRASLILGMTSFHVQMALRRSDPARGKTHLLKQFTGGDGKNDQVQDPMGCTLEVYKKVYREIRAACKRLMKTDFIQAFITGRKQRPALAAPEPDAQAPRRRGRPRKHPGTGPQAEPPAQRGSAVYGELPRRPRRGRPRKSRTESPGGRGKAATSDIAAKASRATRPSARAKTRPGRKSRRV